MEGASCVPDELEGYRTPLAEDFHSRGLARSALRWRVKLADTVMQPSQPGKFCGICDRLTDVTGGVYDRTLQLLIEAPVLQRRQGSVVGSTHHFHQVPQ